MEDGRRNPPLIIMSKKVTVKGVKVSELLNTTYNERKQWSDEEMRAYSTRIMSAMNKRIKRLEKSGVYSQALETVKSETGGRFSVKGQSRKELERTLKQMQNFYNAKTGTIKGAKKSVEKVQERFIKLSGVYVSEQGQKLTQEQEKSISKASEVFREFMRTDEAQHIYDMYGSGGVDAVVTYYLATHKSGRYKANTIANRIANKFGGLDGEEWVKQIEKSYESVTTSEWVNIDEFE